MDNLHKIWKGLDRPKKEDGYSTQNIKCALPPNSNTNMYVAKTFDDRFVVLFENVPNKPNEKYANLEVKKLDGGLKSATGGKLETVLFIGTGKYEVKGKTYDKVNPDEFAKAFNACFDGDLRNKTQLKLDDIRLILKKIKAFTKTKQKPKLEEIVGLWGELFLINELLGHASPDNAEEIVDGWEGSKGKTIIDFNFENKKTLVEVKTTLKKDRIHHFLSLNQLKLRSNYDVGYLASIKVAKSSRNGTSCRDLFLKIYENPLLDNNLKELFKIKLDYKGEELYNNDEYCFVLSDMSFCEFDKVPKPKVGDFILEVEWSAKLSGVESEFLTDPEKTKLLKMFS